MAVESAPENLDLRAAYADALLRHQDYVNALDQAQKILQRRPDHLGALKVAQTAATATDQGPLAESFGRMIRALEPNPLDQILNAPPLSDDERENRERHQHGREIPAGDMFETVKSDIKLANIAGLESVKRRLWLSFLGPLKDENIRKLYKKNLTGGLMLYGPPGCGKTMVGRALAGELEASFINVGIHDILDAYIGESENKVHNLFVHARQKAPCVLFFDEIDAVGRKRSLTRDHAGRNTINQLLSEMDGVASNNEGVYIVSATNHPWDVDAALRRPGRFDRTVLVLPPDLIARESLILQELQGRPQKNIDAAWIAKQTNGFSGADLVHLINSAAELAMEDAITTGNFREITMNDVKSALKEVQPSTTAWMQTARNHAVYSNEGGLYDDLVDYMKSQKMI
jgi:SpoVK/Ycf46/Vps4 family AAA+-type ATPase